MAGSVEDRQTIAQQLATMRRRLAALEASSSATGRRVVNLPAFQFALGSSDGSGRFYAPLTLWSPATLPVLSCALLINSYNGAARQGPSLAGYVRAEWHDNPWSQEELDTNAAGTADAEPTQLAGTQDLEVVSAAMRFGSYAPGASISGSHPGVTLTQTDDFAGPCCQLRVQAKTPEAPGAFLRLAFVGKYLDLGGDRALTIDMSLAVASTDGRI